MQDRPPNRAMCRKGRCDRSLLLLNEAGNYVQNISESWLLTSGYLIQIFWY
jgi:hypothetical protein